MSFLQIMAGPKKGYHTGSLAVHEEAHTFAPSCVPLSITLLLAAALKKLNMNSTNVLEINAYNVSMLPIRPSIVQMTNRLGSSYTGGLVPLLIRKFH